MPDDQRQGVGKTLIWEGLKRLRDVSAQGCCLVGHPDYYGQLGFKNVPGLAMEGVPPEGFFMLPFDERTPQGTVNLHEALKAAC